MIRLTVRETESALLAAQAYEFEDSEISIGQSPSCTLFLPHDLLDRVHVLIKKEKRGWHICDQDSQLGTKINALILSPGEWLPLANGDTITLAGYQLTFEVFDLAQSNGQIAAMEQKPFAFLLQGATTANSGHLQIKIPGGDEQHFLFKGHYNEWAIGQGSDCEMCIQHPSLFPKHAIFVRDGQGMWLLPLPGRLVWLGQSPCEAPQLLSHGQTFRIGELDMCFWDPNASQGLGAEERKEGMKTAEKKAEETVRADEESPRTQIKLPMPRLEDWPQSSRADQLWVMSALVLFIGILWGGYWFIV